MLREDMDALGPVKIKEVESGQQQIIGIAARGQGEGGAETRGGCGGAETGGSAASVVGGRRGIRTVAQTQVGRSSGVAEGRPKRKSLEDEPIGSTEES
jgi:hypothetical protein